LLSPVLIILLLEQVNILLPMLQLLHVNSYKYLFYFLGLLLLYLLQYILAHLYLILLIYYTPYLFTAHELQKFSSSMLRI